MILSPLSEKNKARFADLGASLLFLLLSFWFTLPLLKDLTISCRGDWDYCAHLYEVASVSLFEYGQIPLWNPYSGGGIPLVANPHVGPSLISLLTSLFGVLPGLKIAVWLHTFLGLQGNWLLGRQMGIRGPARFAPPVIFMFCSAWAFHLAEGHLTWLPASLIPLMFLGFLRGLEKPGWLVFAGAVLSMMFYEGGTYVLAFTLLFLGVYAVALSLQHRSLRPLLSLATAGFFAAGFAAPKLLPTLSLLGGSPRLLGPGVAVYWGDLIGSFIDRYDAFTLVNDACYVGVVVVVLYLLSLFRVRGQFPFIVASVTLFGVGMGNFAKWAPWTLLHSLPLFSSFHGPLRMLIVFSFSMSVLVGLLLGAGKTRQPRWMPYLVGLLVVGITVDLFSLGTRILAETPKPVQAFFFRVDGPTHLDKPAELYHVSAAESAALGRQVASLHRPFTQVRVPDLNRFAHGGWSDQYPRLLQNQGVVDAYETLPFQRNARAVSDADYQGEYHLVQSGKGTALLKKWSPNRLVFHVALRDGNRLVVNQNHWPGWRASRGEVQSYQGLLSVELGPGEYDLELRFLPVEFLGGVGILLATLTLAFRVVLKPAGKGRGALR